MYFLECNFDERKIDFVLMHFVRRNFDEQNIDVVLMHLFQPNFQGRKVNIVSVYILVQRRWKTDVTWSCIIWYDFERQKFVVVLISLVDKSLMYFFKVISFYLEVY